MSSAADRLRVSEAPSGGGSGGEATPRLRNAGLPASPPRHIDYETAMLDRYARAWIDLQQTRKALAQRQIDETIVAQFEKVEKQVSAKLSKMLRAHPLWPWLSQFPGLGGAHVALVIGRIGDPRRYPGQRCSEGHYLAPLYSVGVICPISKILAADEHAESERAAGGEETDPPVGDLARESEIEIACGGIMLAPRTTTGVSSLWHWAGLHAVDGKAPRKQKGVKGDWEPRVRASVMQDDGIADQIGRHRPKEGKEGCPSCRFRKGKVDLGPKPCMTFDIYGSRLDQAKTNLLLRVVAAPLEDDPPNDDATKTQGAAEASAETEAPSGRPLRLFEAERIAKKIAAKAFLGDLLVEWKRIAV